MLNSGHRYSLIKSGQATFTENFVPSNLLGNFDTENPQVHEQLEYLELDRRMFGFLDTMGALKDLKEPLANFIRGLKSKEALHMGRILLELVANGTAVESRHSIYYIAALDVPLY